MGIHWVITNSTGYQFNVLIYFQLQIHMSNIFGLHNKLLSKHPKIKIFDNLLKIYMILYASLPYYNDLFDLKVMPKNVNPNDLNQHYVIILKL